MPCALLDDLWANDRFAKWMSINGGYRAARASVIQKHHIWGGKTRITLPSNMLPLCLFVHEFVHGVEPVGGRIACIWKRSQLPEFSWDEMDHCAGLNVRGWVDVKSPDAGSLRWMADEILQGGA